MALPSPLTAYGLTYITLSNVTPIPTPTGFTVNFNTDVPCLMAMDYWSQNDPSLQNLAGSVLEGVLTTQHSITTAALPAGKHGGYVMGFSLRLDANDTTQLTLRGYQGFVQLLGARQQANLQVPVKFYTLGDGTAPPGGGGNGNWSTYKWAQYAPKAGQVNFAATPSSTQSLRLGPGTVYSITITGAGTTAFTLHDDAGSGLGPTIYTSPVSTSLGQVITLITPFSQGLTLVQGLTGPSGTLQMA